MFGRLVSAALPYRTALFVALFIAGPVNTRGKILTSPLSLSLFPSLFPSFLSLCLCLDVLSRRTVYARTSPRLTPPLDFQAWPAFPFVVSSQGKETDR